MVLAVTLLPSNEERVFWDSRNGKNCKSINLCNAKMTDDLKQTLLGFHAFTGSDYVSSVFTKGKEASWKKIIKNEKFIKVFQDFGFSWEIPQEIFQVIKEFSCSKYVFSCSSFNKVRGEIFSKRLSQ